MITVNMMNKIIDQYSKKVKREIKLTQVLTNPENYNNFISLIAKTFNIKNKNQISLIAVTKDNDEIRFEINTTDVKNYKDLLSSNNLYLYIKEVAKKGEKQSEIISKSMKLNSDVKIEVYSNGAKINNANSANSESNEVKERHGKQELKKTACKSKFQLSKWK